MDSKTTYIIFEGDDEPIPFHMSHGKIVTEDLDCSLEELIRICMFDRYYLSDTCYDKNHKLKKTYIKAKETIDAIIAKHKREMLDDAISINEACPTCRKYWKLDDWKFCPWCGKQILEYA